MTDPMIYDLSTRTVTGLILAGGRGQRMGGADKGLVLIDGRTMVAHIIERLRPQVDDIIINANRNVERYAEFGFAVITDGQRDYSGPLAGMASGMRVARTDFIVSVPCDSPFLPEDLVLRLMKGLNDADRIAVAHDGERMQPVFSLLRIDLLASLQEYLDRGDRKIDTWFAQHRFALVDFSDLPDTFRNINTDEQRDAIERELRRESV